MRKSQQVGKKEIPALTEKRDSSFTGVEMKGVSAGYEIKCMELCPRRSLEVEPRSKGLQGNFVLLWERNKKLL